MNWENIEEFLAKYLSGNATSEERAAVEDWIKENPANREEFNAFKSAWDLIDEPIQVDRDKAWQRVSNRISEAQDIRNQTPFLRIAAVVSLFLVSSYFLFRYLDGSSSQNFQSLRSETQQELKLEDASVVTLRPGAKISYPEEFASDKRNVKLEGTAFFDIQRDEQRPFRVETDYGNIKVLGTSFLVKTDSVKETTLVYVQSGKVLVFPDEDPLKGIEVTVNESAEVRPGQVRKIQVGNTNIIAWKSKKIKFKDESLEKVFRDLGEIYGVKISVQDPNLLKCRFSGKFSGLEVKEVLKQLSEIYGFGVNRNGKEFELSNGGC